MYAVIKTGGKQYRVKKGDVIDVELLKNIEDGKIVFEDVLLVKTDADVLCGSPKVEGWTVTGELVDEVRGPKVISYKYKRRKNYHRKIGHRQNYSRVRITDVAAA